MTTCCACRTPPTTSGDSPWPRGASPCTIRTYEPGEPSPYPMYLDHRVYQGSSGAVYPMPFIERVATSATPRALAGDPPREPLRAADGAARARRPHPHRLRQDHRLRLLLPQQRDQARAGGPRRARGSRGGVEFNWPQHHRPATYLPVETTIEHDDDGSVTVWCADHDPFARMRGMHGVRLRPDSAVDRARRAPAQPHRANGRRSCGGPTSPPACTTTTSRSSPTDVHYVADHARRAITAFPARRPPVLRRRLPGARGRAGARRATGSTGTATSPCRRRT